jgi:hypothetical protein
LGGAAEAGSSSLADSRQTVERTWDEPASVSCAELADGGPIGFWASELGFERFDGEVALPAYTWMARESQLPVALARRVGERWTDAYRVRLYDDASDDHEGIPPELCPPRERYPAAAE